jgi:hypothetical protein
MAQLYRRSSVIRQALTLATQRANPFWLLSHNPQVTPAPPLIGAAENIPSADRGSFAVGQVIDWFGGSKYVLRSGSFFHILCEPDRYAY